MAIHSTETTSKRKPPSSILFARASIFYSQPICGKRGQVIFGLPPTREYPLLYTLPRDSNVFNYLAIFRQVRKPISLCYLSKHLLFFRSFQFPHYSPLLHGPLDVLKRYRSPPKTSSSLDINLTAFSASCDSQNEAVEQILKHIFPRQFKLKSAFVETASQALGRHRRKAVVSRTLETCVSF